MVALRNFRHQIADSVRRLLRSPRRSPTRLFFRKKGDMHSDLSYKYWAVNENGCAIMFRPWLLDSTVLPMLSVLDGIDHEQSSPLVRADSLRL
ncbi:hypothetical protein OSTOST_05255 [Ostertagia ostertagi]